MKIGINAYNMPLPDLLQLAQEADRLGFHSIWLGEHVVDPEVVESVHPSEHVAQKLHKGPTVAAKTRLFDIWSSLGALGAVTSGIELATGVYLLPLRHPLFTARSATTIHELTGGRLALGVGAGWMREEFDILDVAFGRRFSMLEEAIEILRDAWSGGYHAHKGTHWQFDSVRVTSDSIDVPLIMAGNTERALRRAAMLGDGWFVSGGPSLDEMLGFREAIAQERRRLGHCSDFRYILRLFEIDDAKIAAFADAGVDEVVVWGREVWPEAELDVQHKTIARVAEQFGLIPRKSIDPGFTTP